MNPGEHSAESGALPTGAWSRARRARGFDNFGPWHYAPDRRNPETGAWRGHGSAGLCGADLYRRDRNSVQRQAERPVGRLCPICARQVQS